VADLHPLWTLIPISILVGIAMLWAFGRFSNQSAIRETKRRIAARLYEFRLFVDEPKLIWQAQAGLLRDNLRYLGLTLVPAVVLALPMLVLFAQLDALYGWTPVRPGQTVVVTVQARQPFGSGEPLPALMLPNGFLAEVSPVRALEKRQISWRLRAMQAVSGTLRVTMQGDSVSKSISAGSGLRYLSKRRVSGVPDLLWHCTEMPIRSQWIDWIEVDYPPSRIEMAGVGLHWAVCFFAISIATTLVLRRRFRVSF